MSQIFDENDLPLVQKAERYCAMDEQCRSSVRAKLLVWGASRVQIDKIIPYLCEEDYVNEERYANAYCDSKLRIQKWGRIKLAYQLRAKQIPHPIIESAIANINPEVYTSVMNHLILAKWSTLPKDDAFKCRSKLINFLNSKGFEPEEVQESLKQLLPNL